MIKFVLITQANRSLDIRLDAGICIRSMIDVHTSMTSLSVLSFNYIEKKSTNMCLSFSVYGPIQQAENPVDC